MRPTIVRSISLCVLWLLALVAAAGNPAWADDRDLLRFDTQKPYVFLLFDTSGSMASVPGDGTWAPANADDPTSKLYSAKQIAYSVFSSATDIQLGFGSFNQDHLRVVGKHWLYTAAPGSTAALNTAGSPLAWPNDGDAWVFGTFFPTGTTGSGVPAVVTPGTLGSCAAGTALSSNRPVLNRFAKLAANDDNGNRLVDSTDSSQSTVMYITGTGNKVYKYTISRATNTPNLGAPTMTLQVAIDGCTGSTHVTANVTFNLVTSFLMNEYATTTGTTIDNQTGTWNYSDVLQDWTCGSKPFSGLGMEGNYDGTYTNPPLPTTNPQTRQNDPYNTGYDPFGTGAGCLPESTTGNNSANCGSNLKYPTTIAPALPGINASTAVLDSGDLLPLDWNDTNLTPLLQRFAPNQANSTPDFGQANYFKDFPNPATGFISLKDRGQIPLLAAGPTSLGAAVVDFRCWYLGDVQGGSKCNNNGNYTTSWSTLAATQDTSWGCRKPYLIVITDGNDTCGGPNPCADTANLNSKAGMQTWVVAYGANCNSIGNPASCMAKNGKGNLVCPSDPTSLQNELLAILGKIREQSREFASAAVPSVQASVSDKIFLSDFTPAQGLSTWEGHVNAFLKPLPLKNGKPDTTQLCSAQPPTQQSQCFLWDGGTQLLTQVPLSGTRVGHAGTQRRIYYSMFTTSGLWTSSLKPLNPTNDKNPGDMSPGPTIRYDLWRGFQQSFQLDNPTPDLAAQTAVNNVINTTESTKTHTFIDPLTNAARTDTYILGDVFHSNPLVIGTPTNTRYFALNLNGNNGPCPNDPSPTMDTGYRCFENRHANRRKVLLVGSNDGLLHAFDAGLPHIVAVPDPSDPTGTRKVPQVQFYNGTGKEVWAYMPRSVMPTVKAIANGVSQHWTVDGSVQAGDVFIDPTHTGTPRPDHREWRTVAIAGLREGPEAGGVNGYYALDLTQPDTLRTDTSVSNIAVPYIPQPEGPVFDPNDYVATCDALNPSGLARCGPRIAGPPGPTNLPYPAPLWEFYDQAHDASGTTAVDANGNPVLIDEDTNGLPDLGRTWSMPTIGRIQIADASGNTVDKYVAIFGGGLDRSNKSSDTPDFGNWLYMVDVETGRVIYKRSLKGCAPSTAAAVDTNQTGLINRIYIGTTSGHMYRVDVGANSLGHLPKLQTVTVQGTDGNQYTEQRIVNDPDSAGQPAWAPREIFSANYNGNTLSALPRSIYYRPSVIFVASLGLYAVSFGTGDREDLWSADPQIERYYMFVDDTDLLSSSSLPLNESAFTALQETSAATTTDILENSSVGHRGWFIQLTSMERVISDSFALAGINTVSTYQPTVCVGTLQPDGTCVANRNQLCSKTGTSGIFVTYTVNGNAVLLNALGASTRFQTVSTFVTPPYTEQAQTKNPSPGGSGGGGTGTNADQLTAQQLSVMNALKSLFPKNCRFGNYRIDIKTVTSDTGVIVIAPVPICIIEKNWKEF